MEGGKTWVYLIKRLRILRIYKTAGKIKKIVNALEYKKDENVVIKAIEILSELNDEETLIQMVKTLNMQKLKHNSSKRISEVFEELIINKKELYIHLFIKCL